MVNKKTIPKASFIKIAFSSLLCLTLVTFLGLGWKTCNSYRDVRILQEQCFRIQGLVANIIHLDEVLTMSARIAAETGDFKWVERYIKFKPQLDAAIKEAKGVAPETFIFESAAQIDAANAKLVAMEKHAFELVRQGQKEDALAILLSEEYQREKQMYTQGMKQFKASMQDHVAYVLKKYSRHEIFAVLTILTILPASFFAFIYILLLSRQ